MALFCWSSSVQIKQSFWLPWFKYLCLSEVIFVETLNLKTNRMFSECHSALMRSLWTRRRSCDRWSVRELNLWDLCLCLCTFPVQVMFFFIFSGVGVSVWLISGPSRRPRAAVTTDTPSVSGAGEASERARCTRTVRSVPALLSEHVHAQFGFQFAETLVCLQCVCHFLCQEEIISLPLRLRLDAARCHSEPKHKMKEEVGLTACEVCVGSFPVRPAALFRCFTDAILTCSGCQVCNNTWRCAEGRIIHTDHA